MYSHARATQDRGERRALADPRAILAAVAATGPAPGLGGAVSGAAPSTGGLLAAVGARELQELLDQRVAKGGEGALLGRGGAQLCGQRLDGEVAQQPG